MLLLISPSKTQEKRNLQSQEYTVPLFLDRCQTLVEELQQLSVEELGQVMSISKKLAELTKLRFTDFEFPVARQKCSPALLTFQGDVYSAIDADRFTTSELSFAQTHLLILSGLYGILRPLDLIQPYRLEMGTKFKSEGKVSLYNFWRETTTSSVNKMLAAMENPLLINLASTEYSKVIDMKNVRAPVINVLFKQLKNGTLRTIAIHAKRARGSMVNYIIKNRLQKMSDLFDFNHDGYHYDEKSSTDTELLFVRS